MIQTIIGKCPSKSNCYKVIKLGNHASLAKTKVLTDYEKSFYLQCNQYRNQNIEGLFELKVAVYYDSNRADLDNSLKIILDCLQKVNAIKNDDCRYTLIRTPPRCVRWLEFNNPPTPEHRGAERKTCA